MRAVGSGQAPDFEPGIFYPSIVSQEFDGLFFIDTTRARIRRSKMSLWRGSKFTCIN
jgi:hypothetical protein